MIRLSDLLDATRLARAVHTLARERDALATLAGQLEGEVGELDRSLGMALATIQTMGGELAREMATAEVLRHELAERTTPDGDHVARCAADLRACAAGWDPDSRLLGNLTAREIAEVARRAMKADPPRDAASPEAEVLRLAYQARDTWSTDVGAPALRRQLQAAEVELAAARSGLEMARAEIALLEAVADDVRAQRKRDLARWAERAACYRSHAFTLARRLRAFVALHGPAVSRLILHAPAVDAPLDSPPPSSTQDQLVTCGVTARSGVLAGMICTLPTGHEGAHEAESLAGVLVGRWVDDDTPPPTQPSERRPVEPAPERAVRVAVSS